MHLDYPTVPYCGPLNQQLQAGAVIQAKGQSNPGANYYAIALQCGPSTTFSDDVALYLSVVFTPPPRIIRNSLIENQWGPEESFGGFPTGMGQMFEFLILVEPESFKIAINGQHFTEFRHRTYFERINHVHITGDVRIDSFSVWYGQNAPSASPYPPAPSLYPPLPNDLPAKEGYGAFGEPYPPANPGAAPYPTGNMGPAPYPTGDMGPAPYPPPGAGPQTYPAPPPYSPYEPNQNPYPNNPYPQQGPYPGPNGYGPGADQTNKNKSSSGGIGSMVGSAIAGVTAGAIGSRLLGHRAGGVIGSMVPGMMSGGHHKHHKHKKSSALPIAGIAAGVGAAALGTALLSGMNPVKKVFKPKNYFGRSSSSSSSEEE